MSVASYVAKCRTQFALSSTRVAGYAAQFASMTDADKIAGAKYLDFIRAVNKKSSKEVDEAIAELPLYTEADIYKFWLNSPVFKNYLQSPACPLTRTWKEYLSGKNFIVEQALAFDNGKVPTLVDTYLGAFLLSDYQNKLKDNRASALCSLDLACEFGLFEALDARCRESVLTIQSSKDDEKRTLAIGLILNDTEKLAQLYGSVGFFNAANYLSIIATSYANRQTEEYDIWAAYFDHQAAEFFFCGRALYLKQSDESLSPFASDQLLQNQKLIKAICKEQGLAIFKFKSMTQAEDKFIEPFINEDDDEETKRRIKAALQTTADGTISAFLQLKPSPPR